MSTLNFVGGVNDTDGLGTDRETIDKFLRLEIGRAHV